MTYLFIGMMIGGILGIAIGSLGMAVYYLKKETSRIKNCGRERENA